MLPFFQITVVTASAYYVTQYVVSSITLRTTLGKLYGPYGTSKTDQVSVSDKVLRYIAGSSGDAFDSLKFYFA